MWTEVMHTFYRSSACAELSAQFIAFYAITVTNEKPQIVSEAGNVEGQQSDGIAIRHACHLFKVHARTRAEHFASVYDSDGLFIKPVINAVYALNWKGTCFVSNRNNPSATVTVEMVDADGLTVWLADVDRDEPELASEFS